MKIIKYLSFLIIALEFSCTKTYTVNIDDIDSRIVLTSIFCEDSLFKIDLMQEASLSQNTIIDGFKTIDNAGIYIYKDNEIIDTATFLGKGRYYSKIKPKYNVNYKILVQTDGYNNVEAENRIPLMIKIDTLIKERLDDYEDLHQYNIKLIFNDIAGINNYYYVDLMGASLNSYEIKAPAIGEWSPSGRQVPIFSDQSFDGQRYEISFDIYINPRVEPEWRYITFSLYSISKEYYLYAESYNNQVPKSGDNLMEYFQRGLIEPIPIYTNVEGGLGIFAGYAVSQDSIYLE